MQLKIIMTGELLYIVIGVRENTVDCFGKFYTMPSALNCIKHTLITEKADPLHIDSFLSAITENPSFGDWNWTIETITV